MNRPTSTRGRPIRTAGLLLLAGLLLWGLPAAAQAIKVTSAVPNTADQGTVGLVVTIGGENFGKGAKVNFYVTQTSNPGGITVRNVNYKNPQTLEATIDVAPDAQTDLKFDIQVMSNGRTGKGTELFKVSVKQAGDFTPPGTIMDLRVVEGSVGFNTAVLAWTAPADDGYDAGSGPAANYDLRIRKESPECGPYTMEIWVGPGWTGPHADPCHAYYALPLAGSPGATATATVQYLAPNSWYWAAVRAVDDSSQGPNWSLLPVPEQQLRFQTGPFPPSPWSTMFVDGCPVTEMCNFSHTHLDLDSSGNPVVLYVKQNVSTLATWTGTGWTYEPTPPIDSGNWMFDLAFDPSSGEAAIASCIPSPVPSTQALNFYRRTTGGWQAETIDGKATGPVALGFGRPTGSAGSVPTVAYKYAKGSNPQLRVARRLDSTWITETVASGLTGYGDSVNLAFDADADPGVAFCQSVNGVSRPAFALRKGGTWGVELMPADPPGFLQNGLVGVRVAWDPHRHDFAVVGLYQKKDTGPYHGQVRFCERNLGTWTCLNTPLAEADNLTTGTTLSIRDDGTVFVSYHVDATVFALVRDPATLTWSTEYVDWNGGVSIRDAHIGLDGQPVIAYKSVHGPTGAGGSDGGGAVSLARRTPPTP